MRTLVRSTVALGLAVLVAAPALAQGPRGGGRGGAMGLMLLQNEGVQKELKLTDEQIDKARSAGAELMNKFRSDFQNFQDKSQDERRELGERMQSESKKAVAGILKPEQQKRYDQLQLQMQGVNAFESEDLQKALKLTDEQKSKLADLRSSVDSQMRELRQGGGGQGNFARFGEIRREAMTKAQALLTDDQKKSWREMTGEPFEFQFGPPRGAPGA